MQATHAYSSMAVSRIRKKQSFQSRTLSTLEDYQSQVEVAVAHVSNTGLSMTTAKLRSIAFE